MERKGHMNQKNSLFFAGLAVFPIGMILMRWNPMFYFIGIVLSFLAVMFQTPRSFRAYEEQDNKDSQSQLKWTMWIVGLYLLSGFVALVI